MTSAVSTMLLLYSVILFLCALITHCGSSYVVFDQDAKMSSSDNIVGVVPLESNVELRRLKRNNLDTNNEKAADDDPDNGSPDDAFPDIPSNVSLSNETNSINHRYYIQKCYTESLDNFQNAWIDVEKILVKRDNKTVFGHSEHEQLKFAYRRAVSYKLHFNFPFYGQEINNITIATGGFLYVGEYMHSWLAATQYIAPLMANFHTSDSNQSNILLAETPEFAVIEFRNVILKSQENAGNFTFQVILRKNGTILFVYKQVPIEVQEVSDRLHPRKVGISDAYLLVHPWITMRRRVIYEYSRIEVNFTCVKNHSVVLLQANPVCISIKSCSECMLSHLDHFNCSWCQVLENNEHKESFCSDLHGLHRQRQDWMSNNCDKNADGIYCPAHGNETESAHETETPGESKPSESAVDSKEADRVSVSPEPPKAGPDSLKPKPSPGASSGIKAKRISHGMSAGGVVAVIFIVGVVVTLAGWLVYAYFNPHSPSGQFLIRYRPSRWRLPGSHSDVRYTASVHM